jgi:fructose-bisphosphate aldolase class II
VSPLLSGYDILDDAEKRCYAVGAFNTVNLEMTRAIHVAAQTENSPFMLASTSGAIKYAAADNIACIARNLNAEYGTRNCLHLDHGPDLDTVKLCKAAGYTSFMYDGSKFPLEENIRLTKEVRDYLGHREWQLEGEIGRLVGTEDGIQVSKRQAFFTDPDEAVRFVRETGVDSLAVSIGNKHGPYKGEPKLDFELLEEIKKVIELPIVLHGASGLSDDDLKRAIELGVRKINFDTDLRLAFRRGLEESIADDPGQVDLRIYMKPAMERVTGVVIHKMKVLGSSGKAGG